MEINYVDRATAKIESEKVYHRRALSLLYGESWAARAFSFFFLPLFARAPWISRFCGFLQNHPRSAKNVRPFISAFNIEASEFETEHFRSFNEFFVRKLKKGARPIDPDLNRAALPADGRYLVFPDFSKTDDFYIKGQRFDLKTFLQDEVLAERFNGGAGVIARLCPTDYHRFHFPCRGRPEKARLIQGPLFSVNPIALRKRPAILWQNKRMITEFHTEKFGNILYVEVGATCVGSIHQTYTPNQLVEKGAEKGFFSFGGSCLVLLFEKGRICLDEDLVQNSAKGLETKALFGSSLGTTNF
jgi:phosphatidylserine decarboxylase